MTNQKRYWLKLPKDFFQQDGIRYLEGLPRGREYSLFYLKLLLKGLDREGRLRFSEDLPYTPPMLSAVTDTDIDVVREALALLQELELIEILPDQTICLCGIEAMILSETKWAEQKRSQRQRRKEERTSADIVHQR